MSNESTLRYTRRRLPAHLSDPQCWPSLDVSALDERAQTRYWKIHKALSAYLQGEPLSRSASSQGLSKAELLRHLNRCVARHADGRIFGWRALRPGAHTAPYRRRAKSSGQRRDRGLAGAFAQLLNDYPQIREALDARILKKRSKATATKQLHEILPSANNLHGVFVQLCIDAGIGPNQYPRNVESQAKSALDRYVREVQRRSFAIGARLLGGADAAVRARVGTQHQKNLYAEAPMDIVSIDAHTIDAIGTVRVNTPRGAQDIPLTRLQFVPLVDHGSNAIFGYHVAIRRECTGRDVLRAVKNALDLWQPRTLTLPGHRYPEGAGMPSALVPALRGCCWAMCLIDNASIHYSQSVAEQVRRRTGWAVNWGPVGQWYRRELVESIFSSLERAGFHRLPNTTGSSPTDPLRGNAAAAAIAHQITWDEMLDLLDVLIATYNIRPQKALGWRSPIQVLRDWVSHGQFLPRRLPESPAGSPELDCVLERCTVRGNLAQGRRPYIQFEHVVYTNAALAASAALIGVELRIHVRDTDMRTVMAFLPDGSELGVLIAKGTWGRIPHDLETRQAVFAQIKAGKLILGPNEEPIQAFLRSKAEQVSRAAQRSSKRVHTSEPATTLVRLASASQLPIPDASTPRRSVASIQRMPEHGDLPSFVRRINHRALVK